MKKFFLALILLLVHTASFASDYTPADTQQIQAKIDIIKTATLHQDSDTIISVMPDKFFVTVAKHMNDDKDSVKNTLKMMLDAYFKETHLSTMEYKALIKKQKLLTSSTGRKYSVIPTETILKLPNVTTKISSNLLAIQDDNQWHLLAIDDKLQADVLMKLVYPDIQEIPLFKSDFELLD